MKKIFTFLFAALMSAGMFADQYTVPSDYVLHDYYDNGDVCVCIYVPTDMDCNNKVLTGSFNGWSTTNCPVFEAVAGYDGWYVASFELEAEPDELKGMQAKPVMLSNSGAIDMNYQVGAATAIRGGVQVVQGAYAGEIDLINYGADAPNVYTVDAWKNNPCTEMPSAKYYVVGNMTNWEVNEAYEMTPNNDALTEEYMFNMDLTTASQFKVVKVEGETQTWLPDGTGNAYGEHGEITKDANYDIYFRPNADGGEGWFNSLIYVARHRDVNRVIFGVNVPANGKPESIEMVGDFEGATWENGIVLTVSETGWYISYEVYASADDEFKIRGAGSWENELYVRNAETGMWEAMSNIKFGDVWTDDTYKGEPVKWVELDYSGANYGWKTAVQGIENIELTEKAKKVVLDGMIYIVRDGKLFNVTGAQVK